MISVKVTGQTRKDCNKTKAMNWLNHISTNDDWVGHTAKTLQKTFAAKPGLYNIDLKGESNTSVLCISSTTYDCLVELHRKYPEARIGALNFASYFNPGGGFLKGAIAQEESLCHKSNLYPALAYSGFYNERKVDENVPAEYRSEVIYSPDVMFTIDDETPAFPVDILSCAAPNRGRAKVTEESANRELRERIELIIKLAHVKDIDYLVLGAWGCGVFKNDPKTVAQLFADVIKEYNTNIKDIIFTMPNSVMFQIFLDTMC